MTSRVSGCASRLAGMSSAKVLIASTKIRNLSGESELPATPTGEQTIEHLLRNTADRTDLTGHQLRLRHIR
ncbi:hypothetical protein [Nocardia fluminea]|nr:hypothetical protein [Nocardia fluminea]